MQQRNFSSNGNNNDNSACSMEEDVGGGGGNQVAPSRVRPTSKLKVLGRSHAMREEQSPPREPSEDDSREAAGQLQSPPTVVLSPSPLEEDTSAISRNGSPSTLVATPNSRCSPQCDNDAICDRLQPVEGDLPPSPKYHNGKGGTFVAERSQSNKSSQIGLKNKRYCDCQNQNCIKCLKDRGGGGTNNNNIGSPNMLYVNRSRGKLRQQSSSQTSFESSTGNSPSLSRDNSSDLYTDTTGVDLEQFIPDTLNRNSKDRTLMLRIEDELINLVNDQFQTHYKFPPMTSYHRMLIHRCAAYFGMDHNVDQTGKSVVVNKTKSTRVPEVRFKEHIKEMFNDEPPRRSILKRDSNSIEDYSFKSPDRGYGMDGRRSKSYEEREEEYEKAKRRIFRGEMHDSSEDFEWSEAQWSSTESEYSRYRLQLPEFQSRQLRQLLKVHSEETEQSMRPCVAKSYSFGGYGGNVSILTRGDSVMSTHSAPGPRLLTKQDSGASSVSWRLSPSSSGYKSQSQMSESVTPSPTSTPHPPGDPSGNGGEEHHHHHSHRGGYATKGPNPVVWAVTDLSNVPKGSIIINPETGKPFKNDDGTIYYYDPVKPASGLLPPVEPPLDRPLSPPHHNNEKTPMSSPKHEAAAPKRSPIKQSPVKSKSNLTNTATSPSLPFSPPLSTTSSSLGIPMNNSRGSYPYMVNSCDNVTQQQQHFGGFAAANAPADGSNISLYSQPYIVYTAAPYTVPVQQQYDARLDQSAIPEIATTYFLTEGAATAAPPQAIAYQTPASGPFWNHQQHPVTFYPNTPQPPSQTPPQQRYSVQIPTHGQTAFVPAGYPTAAVNYVAPQQAPPPQAQNAELVSVYPNHHQAVQMVYPTHQSNGALIYQNQPSLIYAPNPALYQTAAYTTQNLGGYPQGAPTPNSAGSSVPTTPFDAVNPNGFVQLAQSMQQMTLGGATQAGAPRGFVPVGTKCAQPFDPRRNSITGKGAPPPPTTANSRQQQQQPPPRPFLMGSSQSSTGTNSPAATVVAQPYCPTGAPPLGHYRNTPPPPGTPPTPQFVFNQQGGGYPPPPAVAPRLFRQMSGGGGERVTTPSTAKTGSSRSPTPASADHAHFERQRFTFPPTVYHGMPMPYLVQSDPRLVGRGQPNVYRQPTPPMMHHQRPLGVMQQGFVDNTRSHNKNRKPRTNKVGCLPPSGK